MVYRHSKTQVKKWKCETCERFFPQQGNLINHIKTHMKPIKCSKCDKELARGSVSHHNKICQVSSSDHVR